MSTTQVQDFINAAFETYPDVEEYNPEVYGFEGYLFTPTTTKARTTWDTYHWTLNQQDTYYSSFFLSKAIVTENGAFYRVNFTLGALSGSSSAGLRYLVYFDIDKSTGIPSSEGFNLELFDGTKELDSWQTLPFGTVASFSFLPMPVQTALRVLAFAQELNQWYVDNDYHDRNARDLLLASYMSVFINQAIFGIRRLYEGEDMDALDVFSARAAPYHAAIRRWPSDTSSIDTEWSDDAYFQTTFNGEHINVWKPTFNFTDDTWSLVIKFDHDVSGSDGHVGIIAEGELIPVGNGTYASIGNVLEVSSVTELDSSSSNFEVLVSSQNGEDVMESWATQFNEKNNNNTYLKNFGEGVITFMESLMDYLKALSPAPNSATFDVSSGGAGDVYFTADANDRLYAGCSGYVYQLDSADGVVLQEQRVDSNHIVRLGVARDALFAGFSGSVARLSKDNLGVLWQTNFRPSASGKNTYVVARDDEDSTRVFASCDSVVCEVDAQSGESIWSQDLTELVSDLGRHQVVLDMADGRLYCAVAGRVFRYTISGDQEPRLFTYQSRKCFTLNDNCLGNYTTVKAGPPNISAFEQGRIFVASAGYVYAYDSNNLLETLWSVKLNDVDSDIKVGDDVQLSFANSPHHGMMVLAGASGSVVRLKTLDGEAIEDSDDRDHYSVHDGGRGTTHVCPNTLYGLAACKGYVYILDDHDYSKSVKIHVGDAHSVTIVNFGGRIYAGSKGAVHLIPYP